METVPLGGFGDSNAHMDCNKGIVLVAIRTNRLWNAATVLSFYAAGCVSIAVAQSNPAPVASGAATPQVSLQPDPNDTKTYASGKPLEMKSNEGFWGHVNPFARKKWVNRQMSPVKDRLNELDQLSSKNSSDIKDVDQRAQSGIHHAQDTADQAGQQAAGANATATQAQQLAQQSNSRTQQLNSTVANLDSYQPVSTTEIRFKPGQNALNAKAKDALDGIATQLQGQKGFLIEVQGYSHVKGQAGIQSSQRLADSVVRYLVEQHQVPVYRIHVLGMGNAVAQSSEGVTAKGSSVHVTLVQNSLAALNSSGSSGGSPIGATQQSGSQTSPPSVQQ